VQVFLPVACTVSTKALAKAGAIFLRWVAVDISDQKIISEMTSDLHGETLYMIDQGIDPVHIMAALARILVHMTEIHDSASQDAADLIEDAVMMSRDVGSWPNG
tara:strand:+ start:1304 stop:1615 length:312 start_codon:yes stop_codon:yes gene_type:complete